MTATARLGVNGMVIAQREVGQRLWLSIQLKGNGSASATMCESMRTENFEQSCQTSETFHVGGVAFIIYFVYDAN